MESSTVKRILSKLILDKLISSRGNGRGRKYIISPEYNLFYSVDVKKYFEKEIDERQIKNSFDLLLISDILKNVELFTEDELKKLNDLQANYLENISNLDKSEYYRELERLAIDLSWKSSQIEGNTYSLLETELLLRESKTAIGKAKDEASMLLNHKEAIDFITEYPDFINPLKVSKIEDIHGILMKDLKVSLNIRKNKFGISGTNYKPLDNQYQIKEALVQMCDLVNSRDIIFEKALLLLVLLSYIQAFSDGNKRTARIISNAILISNGYCPLSYRTIDSVEYKKAMLVFYEQNNLSPMKNIFINQFEFAVNTYF